MTVVLLAGRIALWALATAALALSGALLARRALGCRPLAPFLLAAFCGAFGLYLALFFATGALGVFSLVSVAAGAIATSAVAHRLWGGGAARREIVTAASAAMRAALAGLRRWPGALAAMPLLVVLPFALRALVAPPLAWDALTYHLVRAATWLQSGRWAPAPGPDAVGYYEYFAPGGDALWAWMLAATHSDALLVFASVGTYLLLVLAIYALARELGGSIGTAAAVAGAVGTFPAALRFATTAYVDDLTAALAAIGALFLLRFLAGRREGDGFVALLAFALFSACKSMSFPPLALATAVVLLAGGRRGAGRRALRALAPLALAAAPLVWSQAWSGSWSTPFEVRIAGRTIAPGDPAFTFALEHPYVPGDDAEFARRLVRGRAFPDWPHLNFGWGGGALAALGFAALLAGLARRGSRARFATLAGLAVWPLAGVMSPQLAALRGPEWWDVVGRLLLPSPALAAAAVATLPSPIAAVACAAAIGLDGIAALPLGWSPAELAPALAPAAVLATLALAALKLAPRLAGRERRFALGALAVALVAWVVWLDALRALSREDSFRRALDHRAPSFDGHPIQMLAPADAARVWTRFDGDKSLTLAVSWGWDGVVGQNWGRYPLFGSHLQNRVVYVPPTRDGSIVSYADRAALVAAARPEAWYARLRDSRVDFLVCGFPWSLECTWAMSDPRRFPVEVVAGSRALVAFRVAPPP